ncbi:MAG: hypothetical protein JW866_00125 [Ignavibacteriales bacterium]|nr:hypothetical protein [Ignavibacteriales bacterium]
MSEEQAVIYGVQKDEKFKYIGKTVKSVKGNRELRKSDVGRRYTSEEINKVFTENHDVNMVVLKTIEAQDWYDEKLKEVVKYKDNHPLVNAQWMLEGKRGYWEGKERDPHTLQRLSESKFKEVVQYDKNGVLVNIWQSGKEVAIQVFRDYRVINGGGHTRLYRVLDTGTLKRKFRYGYYWFRKSDLLKEYNGIPAKLNLDAIRKKEQQYRKANYKRPTTYRRYTIIYEDINGEEIQRFKNIYDAGEFLKISPNMVGKICRGVVVPNNFRLKYGEKELQPIDVQKPHYEYLLVNKKRKGLAARINYDDIFDVDL